MLIETVPLLDRVPSETLLLTEVGANRATSPVGVPPPGADTVTVAVTELPCVMLVGVTDKVVELALSAEIAVCQAAARFVTLTEPSPAAVS